MKIEDRLTKRWTHAGLECGLAPTPALLTVPRGPYNGYVKVPAEHPAAGKDYDDVDVEVHGGLTFAQDCEDGGTWFGWDDVHAWLLEGSAEDETNRLAEQLANMAQG